MSKTFQIIAVIVNLCLVNMNVMMWETSLRIAEEVNEKRVNLGEEEEDTESEATVNESNSGSFAVAFLMPEYPNAVRFLGHSCMYLEIFSPPPELTV